MVELSIMSSIIILVFAFVGWALCAAVMGIGMKYTTLIKRWLFMPYTSIDRVARVEIGAGR